MASLAKYENSAKGGALTASSSYHSSFVPRPHLQLRLLFLQHRLEASVLRNEPVHALQLNLEFASVCV